MVFIKPKLFPKFIQIVVFNNYFCNLDQNQQRNEYIYINREDSNDPSSGLFISDKDFDCLSDLEGKLGSARLLNTEIKVRNLLKGL